MKTKEIVAEEVGGSGLVTDHGYAGTGGDTGGVTLTSETVERSEDRAGDHQYLASGAKRRRQCAESPRRHHAEAAYHALTPPGSRVQSEHSYGTMRDSSPDPEYGGQGHPRGDHLYSADKEDTTEDTETDSDPENNEVMEEEDSDNVRADHQYYTETHERKSPRFRYDLRYCIFDFCKLYTQQKINKEKQQQQQQQQNLNSLHNLKTKQVFILLEIFGCEMVLYVTIYE